MLLKIIPAHPRASTTQSAHSELNGKDTTPVPESLGAFIFCRPNQTHRGAASARQHPHHTTMDTEEAAPVPSTAVQGGARKMSRFGAVSSRYVACSSGKGSGSGLFCLIQGAINLSLRRLSYYPLPYLLPFPRRRWADSDDDETQNEGGSMKGVEEVSICKKNVLGHYYLRPSPSPRPSRRYSHCPYLTNHPSPLPHKRRPCTERRR